MAWKEIFTQIADFDIDTRLNLGKYYHTLTDNIHDGVFIIKNNRIIWCNKRVCEIFGYELKKLYGAYIIKLFPDQKQFAKHERELYFALSEKGCYKSKLNGKHKCGEIIELEVFAALIEKTDIINSEILFIVNEAAAKTHLQKKTIQSERLTATNKLTASIAHEINNPLQGIMASLAAIKKQVPDNIQINKSLEIAEAGLKRIRNIVNELSASSTYR